MVCLEHRGWLDVAPNYFLRQKLWSAAIVVEACQVSSGPGPWQLVQVQGPGLLLWCLGCSYQKLGTCKTYMKTWPLRCFAPHTPTLKLHWLFSRATKELQIYIPGKRCKNIRWGQSSEELLRSEVGIQPEISMTKVHAQPWPSWFFSLNFNNNLQWGEGCVYRFAQ